MKEYLVGLNTFLIFFLLLTSAFINAPLLGWVMDEPDYIAMKSLQGKTGVAVNVDPTGRWIYPLTGMEVTNPRGRAQIINTSELELIINFPNSNETHKIMRRLKDQYGHVYIFISQRTLEIPGPIIFGLNYPEINSEGFINSKSYKLVYNKGAIIFEFEAKGTE